MSRTGACLCGKVTYTLTGEPVAALTCHCKNCQRQAGSAFSFALLVPTEAVTISGAMTTFNDIGETGGILYRRFCPTCGSPIISQFEHVPTLTVVKAGTLDDTTGLAPQMNVWCASALDWVGMVEGTPRFDHNPPSPV